MSEIGRMDHAAAHERIEDLLLEPRRLAALETSHAPEDVALREHIAGCPACAADLDGWRRMQLAVAAAVPGDDPAVPTAELDPIALPPSLLAGLVAAIREPDRREADQPATPIRVLPPTIPARPRAAALPPADRSAQATPARRLTPWLALAASLVLLVGAGIVTVDQVARRSAAESDARELAGAMAVVDRLMATEHKIVPLKTGAGAAAGTISWSRHDWVVLTNALRAPAPGQTYLCWLETDGRIVPIGQMEFAGSTAYWVSSLDEWKTWEIGPTTKFIVTLESGAPTSPTGDVLLSAPLSS